MDLFKRFKKPKELLLSEESMQEWPQLIAEHLELQVEITKFLRALEKAEEECKTANRRLVDEGSFPSIPERAQPVTKEHAKALNESVEKLLGKLTFTADPFALPHQMDLALEELNKPKDATRKSNAALKEYLADETAAIADALQKVEDLIIATGSTLEKKEFGALQKLKEQIENLAHERERKTTYEKTLNTYLAERDEIAKKIEKGNHRLEEQRTRVRSEESVAALERVVASEQRIVEIVQFSEQLAFDARHLLFKQHLPLTKELEQFFTKMKRDAHATLAKEPGALKGFFEKLTALFASKQIEDKKDVVARLAEGIGRVEKDAETLAQLETELHGLKKQIMKDVAALNIYDQRQHLGREEREAAAVARKIDVVSDELAAIDPQRLQNEIELLAKKFGAVIKHKAPV